MAIFNSHVKLPECWDVQFIRDIRTYNRKIHYKWWFSIAMSNYQRVCSVRFEQCRACFFSHSLSLSHYANSIELDFHTLVRLWNGNSTGLGILNLTDRTGKPLIQLSWKTVVRWKLWMTIVAKIKKSQGPRNWCWPGLLRHLFLTIEPLNLTITIGIYHL